MKLHFNPTLGLILTIRRIFFLEDSDAFQSYLRSDSDSAQCAQPSAQAQFQSYLRSDSDCAEKIVENVPLCDFNPTLGLILTI